MTTQWIAFIDDSTDGDETEWAGAVLIPAHEEETLERLLETRLSTFLGDGQDASGVEIKGTAIAGRRGVFRGRSNETAELLADWIRLLREHGAMLVFRGVRSREFARRSSPIRKRGRSPYDIAFGHLLHTIDQLVDGSPTDVVHDAKPSEESNLRETFDCARARGVVVHRRTPCFGLRQLRFADSRDHRLLQAADIATWTRRRRWRDGNPRATSDTADWFGQSAGRREIEATTKAMTAHTYCWRPHFDARRHAR